METKEKRTQVVGGLLALVGLLLVWTLATAGDLEPNSPPGPTMKTLNEVYDAVVEGTSGIAERERYVKGVYVDPNSTYTFFTVPAGKQFVLLKFNMLYLVDLTIDDNLFISGESFYKYDGNGMTYGDFPDRCIVINAGETLKAANGESYAYRAAIAGYFFDVE